MEDLAVGASKESIKVLRRLSQPSRNGKRIEVEPQ